MFSGATANFVKCKFENNTLVDTVKNDAAVIFADGLDEPDYEGYIDDGDALVRVQGCTFSGNTPDTIPTFLADNTGVAWVPDQPLLSLVGWEACAMMHNTVGWE